MSTEQTRYFGKYRGTVVNTMDPEGLARLQAVVPDVLGTAPLTWAMPSVPFAGPRSGFVALPPVGAGVWIEFEQGDPDYPIWSGCWWGMASELPTVVQAGFPAIGQIMLATPGGHALVLSDVPGPTGGIALHTPAGARISVTGTTIVIDNGQGAAITLNGNTVHITGVMV
jgi:uncharacterized protein involved in type VI secretion and phage assembly